MYRTLTQAALSAALATFAFAQTPQTTPNPTASADPAAAAATQTATPSDNAQSFRGILMDASCQVIQNRQTSSNSSTSSTVGEATRSRSTPTNTPTQLPEVRKKAQQQPTRPASAEPHRPPPAAPERADLSTTQPTAAERLGILPQLPPPPA